LKKLERIPLDDLRSLRAVLVLCKELKDIGFVKGRNSEVQMNAAETILQNWSKVKFVFPINFYELNVDLFVIHRRLRL